MDTCPSSRRTLSKPLFRLLTAALVQVLLPGFAVHAGGFAPSETNFDFGHVGIDFKVFHTFSIANHGSSPIMLRSANVPCECTTVLINDTTLNPGESTKVRITLDTYSLFGQNTKSFTITTTDPAMPKFEYLYSSVVGQWPNGLKPDPISLFFLPGQRSKSLMVSNLAFDKLSVAKVEQMDSSYTVSVVKSQAGKSERIQLEVSPKDNLGPGTYFSSFMVRLEMSQGSNPIALNIPVKIVRY